MVSLQKLDQLEVILERLIYNSKDLDIDKIQQGLVEMFKRELPKHFVIKDSSDKDYNLKSGKIKTFSLILGA